MTKKHKKIDWLPIKFDKVGSHLIVQLVNASTLDLSFGFLRDSISKLQANKQQFKLTSLQSWLDTHSSGHNNHDITQPGFIFHIARCGSTLLCQNLKKTGEFVILGEPAFIHQIYSQYDTISPEENSNIARLTIDLWNDWAIQQNKKLVIKLSSTTSKSNHKLLNDFPDSKALYLYREPVAVIESLVRKPPKHLGIKDLPKKSTQRQHVALAAQAYSSSIKIMPLSREKNIASVEYSMLEQYFPDISLYFHNQTEPTQSCYIWNDQWNSKNPSSNPIKYRPISEQEIKRFYLQHKTIIDPIILCYKKVTAFPPMTSIKT